MLDWESKLSRYDLRMPGKVPDVRCGIQRSLGILGERWTFLVLREALLGATRFSEFRANLGVASDVLADRLGTLVEFGVLEKEPYREPGGRTRDAYRLTEAGRAVEVVLAALQEWGDEHLPWPEPPLVTRERRDTGAPVHVAYVDEHGREVPRAQVRHHVGA